MTKLPPQHIAIIMDGNGRWAEKKDKPRIFGHRRGADTLKKVALASLDLGVKYLTVYAFSTENWNRPQDEVNGLMALLKIYISKEISVFNEKNIRLKFIGNRETLKPDIRKVIQRAEEKTKKNDAFTLIVAFNYGAREEIVRAHKAICRDGLTEVDEKVFASYLDTAEVPDPDVLIRTSGEKRISNFLLWQLSYAEFFFTDTLWPDFSAEEMRQIVDEYMSRERRYGLTKTQIANSMEKNATHK